MVFVKRLFHAPKASFFLFGPRGTGKSTWLKNAYKDAIWIDLLESELFRFYTAKPERLRETIEGSPKQKVVIIDEVQKVPELLSQVHAIIEEKKDIQFVLTGSSARKLKREGVNLLAGRALLRKMHPFIGAELKNDFKLERALQIGLLPLVWESESPEEVLKTYAALYLKEEVQAEGLVRQIGDFARFLEVISFSHASLLNTTNIARECDVNRKTVNNYLEILSDLLLSFTVPVFTRRAQRSLSVHPKFYLFDAGVYRSLRPMGSLDRPEEMEGAALEGLVAQHLRAWMDGQFERHDLFFWRTRSGVEVDFIVYGEKGLWALEVKNGSKVSPDDLSGLKAFKEDYPEAKTMLLYRGVQKIKIDGILCVPCEEFLLQLNPDQLLDAEF